jgi:hypothetical protein
MAIDLFTDDLGALANDELLSAVESFAAANVNEGWRHDFTVEWCDSALKKVAAFANTFGGLLLVGIKKDKSDLRCELRGVDSPNEYKTRIASSIAANISPTPNYEVYECSVRASPNKRICVVRLRAGKALHLLTKKGIEPVYVRNEDEARPADAAQLRRLIDREREMAAGVQNASERAQRLAQALVVLCGYRNEDSATWDYSGCRQSDTFLRLSLVPTEVIPIALERSVENRVVSLINELYPRVYSLVRQSKANDTENRDADFYEYVWYHKSLDYEERWRVISDGAIGHSTQMAYKDPQKAVWSVVDLAVYIILFLRLGMRWWKTMGYFGEGNLYAQLSICGLGLLQSDSSGTFGRCFDPTYESTSRSVRQTIPRDAVLVSGRPREQASAEIRLTYFTATDGIPRLATSLLNSLLRSLGHAAVWEPLEQSIRLLAAS